MGTDFLMENKLGQKFNFTGVPISIYLREK
jgi:hypothetical protein